MPPEICFLERFGETILSYLGGDIFQEKKNRPKSDHGRPANLVPPIPPG